MVRDFARRHQDRVEADIANVIVRIAASHTSTAGAIRRRRCRSLTNFRSLIKVWRALSPQRIPGADAGARRYRFRRGIPPAPRQNAESLCDQESGGAALDADAKRCLPFGARARFYRARRMITPPHCRTLGERERTLVDLAARTPVANATSPTASLTETRISALAQQGVDFVRLLPGIGGWRHNDCEFAAHLRTASVFACQDASRSPRLTSSCNLVISRQIATVRGPNAAARSASIATRREPLSNSTNVAGIFASAATRFCRAAFWSARNPRRRNGRLAGLPMIMQPRRRTRREWRTACPASQAARTSL